MRSGSCAAAHVGFAGSLNTCASPLGALQSTRDRGVGEQYSTRGWVLGRVDGWNASRGGVQGLPVLVTELCGQRVTHWY